MMKFYFMLCLTGCLSLLAALHASGQGANGFVVTTNGDTLRGYVSDNQFQQVIFYAVNGGEKRLFTPAQVLAYGVGKTVVATTRLVRMRSGQDSLRLVQPLLIGPASLHTLHPDSLSFVLQPPGSDTLYELTKANWQLLYNRHLTGCSQLDFSTLQVSRLPFRSRWLTSLVGRYNRCVQPGWQPARKATTTTLSTGVVAGAIISSLTDPGVDAESQTRLGGSASVEMRLNQAGGWWLSAGLAAQYLRGGLQPISLYTGTSLYSARRTLFFEQTSLFAQLSIGRAFGRPDKVRPFVFLRSGAGQSFNINYRIDTEYSSTRPRTSEVVSNPNRICLQANIGAGLLLPVAARQQLQLSLQYGRHYLMPDVPLVISSSQIQLLTLSAGYFLLRR